MNKRCLITTFLLLVQPAAARSADLPAVIHYRLDVRFQLTQHRVDAIAELSIRNTTTRSFTKLPFLLYRLLTVERVAGHNGRALTFSQDVVQLNDEPSLQARAVTVELPSPLAPNDSTIVVMTYGGFIFGYPEVMAYVKDRIDEDYSLLRPDSYAYPLLAEPTLASSHAAHDTRFTYDMLATVPKRYTVACGGEEVDTHDGPDSSVFVFRSKVPTWRIDVAVARFSILHQPVDNLTVYHQPADSAGAQSVLVAARDAVNLYSELFGRPEDYGGYTIIEVPDGWGSQAGDYYLLQTAGAFKDSSRISEVYHEVGHSWNATPAADVQRCRYFDEAFASYFESLAIRAFRGEKAFEEDMEKARDLFARWATYDRAVFDTPISDYGAKELGRHSYTKGAWSLYVLHHVVGDRNFRLIIQSMLTQFSNRTINFDQFQKLSERVAQRNLSRLFQEWIYGVESSRLLVDKVPIAEILRRYEF
jgi:hypothetical protein